MKGVGLARVEELLRAVRATNAGQVAAALNQAGFEIQGVQYGTIAYDLVESTGSTESAVRAAFDLWSTTATNRAKAALDEALASGRGPNRKEQPQGVDVFFKHNGMPTLLGDAVLGMMRSAARREARAVKGRPARATKSHPTASNQHVSSQVAGRWDIVSRIAKTNLAELFEAKDAREHHGLVVLKRSPDVEALRREFDLNNSLHHDHICRYYFIDKDEQFGSFIVMEHGGRSLARVIEGTGEMAWEDVLPVITAVASALHYAERHGVIHQDVKPENILIDDRGHVRVTDFNTAVRGRGTVRADGAHTVMGTSLVGFTPGYQAPEQEDPFAKPRSATDQHGLALVVCSMLEGRVFRRDERYRFQPFSALDGAANEALRTALARNPDHRFATIDKFIAALGRQ